MMMFLHNNDMSCLINPSNVAILKIENDNFKSSDYEFLYNVVAYLANGTAITIETFEVKKDAINLLKSISDAIRHF